MMLRRFHLRVGPVSYRQLRPQPQRLQQRRCWKPQPWLPQLKMACDVLVEHLGPANRQPQRQQLLVAWEAFRRPRLDVASWEVVRGQLQRRLHEEAAAGHAFVAVYKEKW